MLYLDAFIEHVDYFVLLLISILVQYKIMFQRMCRDDYLLHCNMQYIIVTRIEFPCVHWQTRIAATDVYVTLPPKSKQV